MIGTEDMSTSTGMDISESFRAEDLSKTDFFDFVTAPDMGIGIGVGVGVDVGVTLQQQHHQQQQHSHNHNHSQATAQASLQRSASNMTHDCSEDVAAGIVPVSNRNGNSSNGGDPTLQGYERAEAEQLPSALDLDSLLGSFPGYIKSEYPYDDSGFSTDGKDVINVNGGVGVGGGDANGLSNSISQSQTQHGQTLPSLVTAISLAGGGGGVNELGQQLAQFQNNNNDWHMADHNAEAEQNTAESLLRSALQGKGYAKGLHMQNGLALPVVKDDDMRRLLFTPDDAADALGFADSTLSTAQMFEDAQSMGHVGAGTHMATANHGQHGAANASIIVDDMFLSLENAFSDDFEKIKRIANEVQQYCSTPTPGEYNSNDVLMQISPNAVATAAASTTTAQLQPLANAQQQQQQQQQQAPQPPPQPLKPEVSTSTATAQVRLGGVSKPKKQYKRSNSSANNNNNNNPSVVNNNSSSTALGVVALGSGGSSSSSGSASSSSNSPPANCNNSASSNSSSGGGSGSGAQRKERSLHYCSICSKGFKDKYSVNVHIRTHTGEKPFACSLCGKSFRQKAHLAKHYQTHMTQKNNGNLIKGNAAKHQRGGGATAATSAANVSSTMVQQQRQLSVVPTVASASLMSASVVLNGPNTPTAVLPPANGLLANR
ncbi:CG4374 [Drosophila busckii]|uniref:CG4374 n=1 Tax=Drosophila busckii TaxID=30019 RepID=A0A0M3QY25_DROBS|nr:CG4374 [Drosophila busckii]